MGAKIPYDIAMKSGGMRRNASIYNQDKSGHPCRNLWGYRYNINHPDIRPLYEAYHKHIGVPEQIHLTSAQRLYFEMLLDRMIEQRRSETHVQQSDPDGQTDS